jgi:hypothetical protein
MKARHVEGEYLVKTASGQGLGLDRRVIERFDALMRKE